jgi:hypothetical protein
MVIIYGHRAYGRVEDHGGEHALTTFVHVYYVPLVPTGSMWVTRDHPARDAVRIGLHGKSIAAAYLRTWGLAIAAACLLFAPGPMTALVAAGMAALSAWSWSWRRLRGNEARRRSDFNLLAFGTRCEPQRLPRSTRAVLQAALEAQRVRLGLERPPEDVARFGAASRDEAVIAYGLLRLAAIEHRSAEQDAAVARLLSGNHDALPAGEGPYREAQDKLTAAVHDEIGRIADEHAQRVGRR